MTSLPTSLAEEGKHTIDIEVSLESQPEIRAVATVTIIINPCQVARIESNIEEVPLSYSVNTPATTGALYTFSQVGAECGYEENITVADLPSFATHDETEQSFTV